MDRGCVLLLLTGLQASSDTTYSNRGGLNHGGRPGKGGGGAIIIIRVMTDKL